MIVVRPKTSLGLFSYGDGLRFWSYRGGPPPFPAGFRSFTGRGGPADFPATQHEVTLALGRRLGIEYRRLYDVLFCTPDQSRILTWDEFARVLPRTTVALSSASVGLPHAEALAFFSVPPLLWLALCTRRLVLLRRRRGPGLCPTCGYDLTGNTSGVCSECGTAVEAGRRVTA